MFAFIFGVKLHRRAWVHKLSASSTPTTAPQTRIESEANKEEEKARDDGWLWSLKVGTTFASEGGAHWLGGVGFDASYYGGQLWVVWNGFACVRVLHASAESQFTVTKQGRRARAE